MPSPSMQLIVQTPQERTLDVSICSLRVPTESGQVGLRPMAEATLLAVEPGVIQLQTGVRQTNREQILGTAGGVLISDGRKAKLFTPIALIGTDARVILDQLDETLRRSESEMDVRATLGKLEGRILNELRRDESKRPSRH